MDDAPLYTPLLYTFSTIPQTIAAALGVLAAFVLYRLQSDSASLREDAKTLIGAVDNTQPTQFADPPATLSKLLGSERYKELLAELEYIYQRDPTKFPPSGSGQEHAYLRLKANIESRDRILAALKIAFWVTAPVILGSVLALCGAHTLSQCTAVAGVLFAVGAASLSVCLWLYWRIIGASLFDQRAQLTKNQDMTRAGEETRTQKFIYGWIPLIIGFAAPVASFWLDRLLDHTHPQWSCGELTERAGSITALCGAIAGYRGAKAFITRVGAGTSWVLRGPHFDLPYGWIALVLAVLSTAVWGYGRFLLPKCAIPGCE